MSSGFERIAAGLVGAAFGLKVLDGAKPLWARAAYGAVAFDLISNAVKATEHPLLGDPAARLGDAEAKVREVAKMPVFKEKRVRNIDERVAYVHTQMIQGTRDPKIYKLKSAILSKRCDDGKGGDTWCIPEKDAWAEATAFFNEVRKRVRYTWDPTDFDAFQTPAKTLELQTGDCDDYTSLLGALCRTAGHQVRSRIVQLKGSSQPWDHIYLRVKVGNGWKTLDCSVDKPAGWEVPDDMVQRKQDYDVVESGAGPTLDK